MQTQISKQEKTHGIINYITFVGMIIAYFMNRELKSTYVTYHIKIMFGLVLLLFISQVSHAYIHYILGDVFWLLSFVLWVLAFVSALQGKIPRFGGLGIQFQKWFTFLE